MLLLTQSLLQCCWWHLFDMLVPFAALEVFGDVVPVFFFLSLDFLKLSLEGLKLINDGLQGLSAFSVHIYSP